jgi:hypothetical protein
MRRECDPGRRPGRGRVHFTSLATVNMPHPRKWPPWGHFHDVHHAPDDALFAPGSHARSLVAISYPRTARNLNLKLVELRFRNSKRATQFVETTAWTVQGPAIGLFVVVVTRTSTVLRPIVRPTTNVPFRISTSGSRRPRHPVRPRRSTGSTWAPSPRLQAGGERGHRVRGSIS